MRCPVCKADNTEGPACRRCKADLSLLWSLEARRKELLNRAGRRLGLGEWQLTVGDPATARLRARAEWLLAADDAASAARLRAGADAGRIVAIARLLNRDFTEAFRAYRRVKGEGDRADGAR
jgi:hypothetical protein